MYQDFEALMSKCGYSLAVCCMMHVRLVRSIMHDLR